MIVKVVDRTDILPQVRIIEILDYCPVCGEKRGLPYGFNFYEDGNFYHVHRWENPCGHIDFYDKCLEENGNLNKQKKSTTNSAMEKELILNNRKN